MRTPEQRSELDNDELEKEYDFSEGVRGRFYKPKKKASEEHIGYQTLINSLLRDHIKHVITKEKADQNEK